MRAAVRDRFPSFTQQFEGRVHYMYPDIYGYVSTGVGNLIDPIGAALGLPWVHKSDGSPASQDEIVAEWQAIKSDPDTYKTQGAGGYSARTQLMLTDESIDNLVRKKLDQNDAATLDRYPDFESWPADAQLAHHSMVWAMGPAFNFPKYKAAVESGNWAGTPDSAAGAPGDANQSAFRGQAWINDTTNPGVRPRNLANKKLFENAQAVIDQGGDPDTVYYPGDVTPLTFTQRVVNKWTIVGVLLLLGAGGYALMKVKP